MKLLITLDDIIYYGLLGLCVGWIAGVIVYYKVIGMVEKFRKRGNKHE